MDQRATGQWTTEITPRKGWFDLGLRELWAYRDLIRLLVRRDFVAVYKQTVLGPLWFIIQPLLTTLVFTMVFGHVAGMSTDGLPKPLFYLGGVVGWRYFADCLTKTSNSLRGNAHLFGKVYFPRLAVPVSVLFSNCISFGIQLTMLAGVMAWYAMSGIVASPDPSLLVLVPVLIVIMAMLGLGGGLLVSALTARYRDFSFVVGFGVQLFMYATPVIYPSSMVPEKYKIFVMLNPMAPVIEAFRAAFLGVGSFTWPQLGGSAVAALVLFFLGVVAFSRVSKDFMDTV